MLFSAQLQRNEDSYFMSKSDRSRGKVGEGGDSEKAKRESKDTGAEKIFD